MDQVVESISKTIAVALEDSIRDWFLELNDYLRNSSQGDPSQIVNGEKTNNYCFNYFFYQSMIIFPYVRPPKEILNNMPESWFLGHIKGGQMKSFFE